MAEPSPPVLLIMLADDDDGGRIVAGLESFVAFADQLARDLARLEIRWADMALPQTNGEELWDRHLGQRS